MYVVAGERVSVTKLSSGKFLARKDGGISALAQTAIGALKLLANAYGIALIKGLHIFEANTCSYWRGNGHWVVRWNPDRVWITEEVPRPQLLQKLCLVLSRLIHDRPMVGLEKTTPPKKLVYFVFPFDRSRPDYRFRGFPDIPKIRKEAGVCFMICEDGIGAIVTDRETARMTPYEASLVVPEYVPRVAALRSRRTTK